MLIKVVVRYELKKTNLFAIRKWNRPFSNEFHLAWCNCKRASFVCFCFVASFLIGQAKLSRWNLRIQLLSGCSHIRKMKGGKSRTAFEKGAEGRCIIEETFKTRRWQIYFCDYFSIHIIFSVIFRSSKSSKLREKLRNFQQKHSLIYTFEFVNQKISCFRICILLSKPPRVCYT